jgi:hypothetical protein
MCSFQEKEVRSAPIKLYDGLVLFQDLAGKDKFFFSS